SDLYSFPTRRSSDLFYVPGAAWHDNRVFDLMVERTYGAMTNDVLISIPLFVLMGYVMERGALVDKMFYSIQLAFRKVPASLAVRSEEHTSELQSREN